MGILNDKPYSFPKKPTALLMSRVIEKEGIEAGIQFFKDHKDLSDYKTNEQDLIVEGYRLLHAENVIDAAKIFKLSIEVYPNKDNPYDSYAESQMILGNKEGAIKNYRKSLSLNPKNQNAVNKLKILGASLDSN